MRRYTCDGCLDDIEEGDDWFGMDEFASPDEDGDEDSPENDYEYAFHFHATADARCVWAWASQRALESSE